jgi:ribosome-associated protein
MAKQKNEDAPNTKRSTAGSSRSTSAGASKTGARGTKAAGSSATGTKPKSRGPAPERVGRSGARETPAREGSSRGSTTRASSAAAPRLRRSTTADTESESGRAPSSRARTTTSGSKRPLLKATHAEAKRAATPARNAKEAGERRERARATLRAVEGRATQSTEPGFAREVAREPTRGPASARKRASLPPARSPSSESKELALAIASAGLDKKALGVEVLDVTGRVDYAEFLVVMTGTSDRHVHSIAMGIEEELRKRKLRPLSVEGLGTANWVLMDFDDVVVHVFQESTRKLYDIEGLWIDAGRISVAEPGQPSA